MTKRLAQALMLSALAITFTAAPAADLNPGAVAYTLPDNIQWKDNAAGTNASAILYGDPAKPGPYAMLLKWKPGNMSRPNKDNLKKTTNRPESRASRASPADRSR